MDNKINGNVLVIEDSPAAANYAKRLLERNDITDSVTVKINGEEALDFILNVEVAAFPKLILLDLNMPLLGGFGFLSQYEKLIPKGQRKDTLIVLLSTSILESDLEKSKQFIDVPLFLTKPLTKNKLEEITERYHFKINKLYT